MKKKIIIVMLVFVIVIAGYAVFHFNKEENVSENKTQNNIDNSSKIEEDSNQNLEEFINKVYANVPENTLPMVQTTKLDLTNLDSVKYNTGINSVEGIDEIYLSEAMITSQAYSCVVIKVNNAEDSEKIQKEMFENIDPRKWICVSADKIYSVTSGNIIALVMSSEEMAKPVYESIKKEFGNDIGKELEKTVNETLEVPTENFVQ